MASAERVNEKVRALPLPDSYSSYACRRCVHSSAVFRMAAFAAVNLFSELPELTLSKKDIWEREEEEASQ